MYKKETLKNVAPKNHSLNLIGPKSCEINVKVAGEQTDKANKNAEYLVEGVFLTKYEFP